MIWRCQDRAEPPCDYQDGWWEVVNFRAVYSTGDGIGQGAWYLIGYDSKGNGCGMGFDHGMLNGDNVKWGDR